MATVATIPISEYLATSYSPDRDYIDGEVKERNLGETFHGGVQSLLAALFFVHRLEWGLRAYTETRVQVARTRFRIPDVCVVSMDSAYENILREPPLLCVEVLSPGDTLTEMQERVDDYIGMGIKNIWLIDPVRRRYWTADADGIHLLQQDSFTVRGTAVRIALVEIGAELDSIANRK